MQLPGTEPGLSGMVADTFALWVISVGPILLVLEVAIVISLITELLKIISL